MNKEEISQVLDLPPGVEIEDFKNGGTPYSFHVQLSPRVARLLFVTFRTLWRRTPGSEEDIAARKCRAAVFRTDLVEQLMALDEPWGVASFYILGLIGETHQERTELVSRGLPRSISHFASTERARTDIPLHYYRHWRWALNNHIFYLTDDNLNIDMIHLVFRVLFGSHIEITNKLFQIRIALQALEQITLRGPCVRAIFRREDIERLKEYCVYQASDANPTSRRCSNILAGPALMTGEYET